MVGRRTLHTHAISTVKYNSALFIQLHCNHFLPLINEEETVQFYSTKLLLNLNTFHSPFLYRYHTATCALQSFPPINNEEETVQFHSTKLLLNTNTSILSYTALTADIYMCTQHIYA